MTSLRDAAQQALEALEADCGGRCNAEYNPCWQRQAAETLRAALAEPENWELRRLREELERCKQVCAATSESWRIDAEKWKGQRDALLEALQDLCDEQEGPPLVRRHRQWQAAIDKARAAIKAAEENT